MDKNAFYKLSYGLYIISSISGDKTGGLVVNTLNQVTAQPVRMSVTLSKESYTTTLIQESKIFAATVLTEDVDMNLVSTFGFATSKNKDKFSNFNTAIDIQQVPYVLEYAAALFSCRVVDSIDLGTHVMFIADVVDAKVLNQDPVITYSYYRNTKKGFTPKNAPSYQAPTKDDFVEKSSGYRCTICGYVYKEDSLPDNYICPICGQGSDKFKPL